jgi:serine/threonine protein kinase
MREINKLFCFLFFVFVFFAAAGLQALQEKHLIHRDLKPQVH